MVISHFIHSQTILIACLRFFNQREMFKFNRSKTIQWFSLFYKLTNTPPQVQHKTLTQTTFSTTHTHTTTCSFPFSHIFQTPVKNARMKNNTHSGPTGECPPKHTHSLSPLKSSHSPALSACSPRKQSSGPFLHPLLSVELDLVAGGVSRHDTTRQNTTKRLEQGHLVWS